MIDITQTCTVVFRGELVAGSDTETVKEKLMAAFKLNRPQVDKLLTNAATVLKRGLSMDQAARYQAAMQKLGLICHIATRSDASTVSTNTQATKNETPVAKTEVPLITNNPQSGTESAAKLTQQMIDSAFRGDFKAAAIDRKYMTSITATALVMLLLPMTYISITFLIGHWTLRHISSKLAPVTGIGSGIIAGVLYLIPILIGIALLLFLSKPLFARSTVKSKPITLDPIRHRRFFHFVECICAEIGAPKPREIHVDGYVNSAARLKHGVISNQLILTVGMPLIMGLNTRELAGVLAHEVGHFAQRHTMRQGHIINAVNHWLYRVAHERDNWDEYLDQWLTKNENRYLALMGQGARFCIWLTRSLLHNLMLLGIQASRYMSRQMEFNADLYEARLAGSQQFRRTNSALRLLSSAFANAQRRNSAAMNKGDITDNLPQLAVNIATTLPTSSRHTVSHQMKSAGNPTYPTEAERIEHAELESSDGIFKLELPAYLLLHDHERLNKQSTLNYYQNEGIEIGELQLVAPEKILEADSNCSEDQTALEKYFNGQFHMGRILPLFGAPDHLITDTAKLQMLIDETHQRNPEMKSMVQEYEEIESRVAWLRVAYAFVEAGITIDERTFNLPSSDKNVVEETLTRTLADYHSREAKLRHYEKMMGQRLSQAVALAYDRSDTNSQQQITLQWRALLGLGKIRETLTALLCYGFVLAELYAYGETEETQSSQICKSYLRLCNREIEHIQSVLSNYRDPFADDEESTLAQRLQQWIEERRGNARNEIEICLNTKQAVIDALLYLNSHITGALAVHATHAERTAGIKPIQLVQ